MDNEIHGYRRQRTLMLGVIVLLLLAVVYLLVDKMSNRQDVEEMAMEFGKNLAVKDSLTKQLDDLYARYNSVKTDNADLNSKFQAEKEKIQKLLTEMKSLKVASKEQIERYKQEAEMLRGIMKGYIRQIDSLHTVNQALVEENLQIKNDFQEAKNNNKKLANQNENLSAKVAKAAIIKALNIKAFGINEKGKEAKKINKVEKIKVMFTLDKNEIVDAGMRDIYVRVIRPDDYLIHATNDLFAWNGEKIGYTAKKSVNYSHESLDVEIFCDVNDDLIPGTYNADLYCDGSKIGTTSFVLK